MKQDVMMKVGNLLERYPETRDSDKILCQMYYKLYEGVDTQLSLVETPLESITRCRRKLQQRRPDLEAQQMIKQMRSYEAEEYRIRFGSSRYV